MRVAVASSDGKFINQHFGHAKQFYIFEEKNEHFRYLELRNGKAFCDAGEHDHSDLKNAVSLISDCNYVLAVQAGYGAIDALNQQGISVKMTQGFINDCLDDLINELPEGSGA
jgi:predicted Fe-Mo cluster-binding NifX family protein